MRIVRITICLIGAVLVAACSEPPQPVSVAEFMENPRLLEATMVRCGQNRSEMKYESDCVNARDAINRIERAEERARRAQLEAQSERKRQALRRTQEAAAAARRRAEEEQRRRDAEEYLGIFDDTPPGPATDQQASTAPPPGNIPGAIVEPEPETEAEPVAPDEPEIETPEASDLGQVRQELQKRQQAPEPNQ